MKNCPFCKTAYKQGAAHCHGCGRQTVEYRICSNRDCRMYNKVLPDDEAFCVFCGAQSANVYASSKTGGREVIIKVITIALIILIIITLSPKPPDKNIAAPDAAFKRGEIQQTLKPRQ